MNVPPVPLQIISARTLMQVIKIKYDRLLNNPEARREYEKILKATGINFAFVKKIP